MQGNERIAVIRRSCPCFLKTESLRYVFVSNGTHLLSCALFVVPVSISILQHILRSLAFFTHQDFYV